MPHDTKGLESAAHSHASSARGGVLSGQRGYPPYESRSRDKPTSSEPPAGSASCCPGCAPFQSSCSGSSNIVPRAACCPRRYGITGAVFGVQPNNRHLSAVLGAHALPLGGGFTGIRPCLPEGQQHTSRTKATTKRSSPPYLPLVNALSAYNVFVGSCRKYLRKDSRSYGACLVVAQGNNIGNLGGLNRCRTLVEVNLDGNKIRQLGPPSAFNGLGNLRKLRLEDNGLRVLSPGLGASTPALLSLSLAQNRLSDPAELDRLGALPNLMELSVCGNPMARYASRRRESSPASKQLILCSGCGLRDVCTGGSPLWAEACLPRLRRDRIGHGSLHRSVLFGNLECSFTCRSC